jgi:hypothetical protein
VFDTELHQHVFGLAAPWPVAEVKVDDESFQIQIHVENVDGSPRLCPQCQKALAG